MKTSEYASISWQQHLQEAITSPTELLALLALDEKLLLPALSANELFKLKVPRGFVARMQKGNPDDPLLKQVLPIGAELIETAGYIADPLQEKSFNPIPGLLHKYKSRILINMTGSCAINCRYCFRRHFNYQENNPGRKDRQKLLDYIWQHPEINEVILSGLEPLLSKDTQLAELYSQLAEINHLKILRIHSRIPIVLPERITQDFLAWFAQPRFKAVLVTHCNHPQELDDNVKQAMDMMKQAGITLLNQAVILKGINDNISTLTALSYKLFDYGILPYYLHVPDKVKGTAHFDLTPDEIKNIYSGLMAELPGYLLPKLVQEVPGATSKTLF